MNRGNPSLSVLLVDDAASTRAALRAALADCAGVHVVGEAGDVTAAIHALAVLRPDVVVLDFALPDGSGLDVLACATRCTPPPVVLFLSIFTHDYVKASCLAQGALHFFDKATEFNRVCETIAALAAAGRAGDTFTGVPRAVRVLLVDASAVVRQRVHSLIEESGSVEIVGEADTAAGALALFHQHLPDAVVMDMNMENGNGFKALQAMKSLRPACVVAVLTSMVTTDFREACLELGADHFFDKSREFELVPEVLAALRQQLARPDQGLAPAAPPEGRGVCA